MAKPAFGDLFIITNADEIKHILIQHVIPPVKCLIGNQVHSTAIEWLELNFRESANGLVTTEPRPKHP